MPTNTTELPEGTDKVIAGASTRIDSSATGTDSLIPGTSAAGSEAGGDDVLSTNDANIAVVGGDTTTTGGTGVLENVRSSGGKIAGQAADKARGLLSQGLERSAEALGGVAKMIGDTAAGIDERLGEEYGDYARRAATSLESTANSIAAKDAEELIDDTRNFVRKSPGIALAGAAIVGFALARLIKSGIAPDDADDRSGKSGSRSSES